MSTCRLNSDSPLINVVDLGTHSLCGNFPASRSEQIGRFPLSLGLSTQTGLLQLTESPSLEDMYGMNYGYRSSLNKSMVAHLSSKVEYLMTFIDDKMPLTVLDIGSNDGTLLSFYPKSFTKIGIDPTIKKFKEYYNDDIITCSEFFTSSTFSKVSPSNKADIITSISMFYDLPDPVDFVSQVKDVLSKNGIWHFEQSYMPSMLRTNSYDTICHEHLEYYSLQVVQDILAKCNMRIIDVSFNSINGGSFAVTASHDDSKYDSNRPLIDWMLSMENRMKLNTPTPYRLFEDKAYAHKQDLSELLKSLNMSHQTVAGYGASTKGNVILQFCELTTDLIFGIAEVNPDKYNKFTPGQYIPIHSEEDIKSQNPDYMLVLPWHFRNSIIQREQDFLRNGGKLIFPLPEIEIVG